MNDLDSSQKTKLLAIKKERDDKIAAASQPPVAEIVIEGGEIPSVEAGSELVEAVPAVVTPIVDTAREEASNTNPAPAVPAEEEFKWDADLEQTPASTPTSGVDIKKIGSALNLEVTNEDEFVKTVSEKMSKLKQLEEASANQFQGVPEHLKETIEIAKKGGDWQSFIGNSILDPSQLDPIDLFEREYERSNVHRFKQADGTIDYEKLDEEIDSIADGVKSMQGTSLKQQLIRQQHDRKQAILTDASKTQDRFNKELAEAAKELPQYFPKEEWGVSVEAKHASAVIDGIATGKLIKKHLGDIDQATLAKLDGKKIAKAIFLLEAGKNIAQHQYKQGIVAGKRELLDKVQNPQINAPGTPAAPDVADDKRPKTAVEKLKEKFAVSPNSL